ncbi:MAG: hypothetical protein OXH31_01800 [Gammaproteobacteria bacterium]|nr:hypothetical protein [Gammaproteobacteria bacterium]
MGQSFHTPRWPWIAAIGIGLAAVAAMCVFWAIQNRIPPDPTALGTSTSTAFVPSESPTVESVVTAVDTPFQLSRDDLPLDSVEQACELDEFPPYWDAIEAGTSSQLMNKALDSVECQIALENHVKTIHPYLWANADDYQNRAATFILVDEPLTFERIFADPAGDLLRVEGALSHPECLLKGDESNWELKEICHAGSFLNYALVNHFCFGGVLGNDSGNLVQWGRQLHF